MSPMPGWFTDNAYRRTILNLQNVAQYSIQSEHEHVGLDRIQ